MIGLEYIVKEFRMEYKDVAENVGVSSQTIQDWLKKRRKIPKKRLELLSELFKLPEYYFQKELNYVEKDEITLHYLKVYSEKIEIPIFNNNGEIEGYQNMQDHEEEIRYLEENIMNRKDEKKVLTQIQTLLNEDEKNEDDITNSPFILGETNSQIFQQITNILQRNEKSDRLKLFVHLLNDNNDLGGNVLTNVLPEYRDFAKELMTLLNKYKLKN